MPYTLIPGIDPTNNSFPPAVNTAISTAAPVVSAMNAAGTNAATTAVANFETKLKSSTYTATPAETRAGSLTNKYVTPADVQANRWWVMTDAQRLALTSTEKGPVCIVYCTDTGITWLWKISAWKEIDRDDTGWNVVTTSDSNYYFPEINGIHRALSLRRVGEIVRMEGHIRAANSTSAGSKYAAIPAGFKPERGVPFLALNGRTGATIPMEIDPDLGFMTNMVAITGIHNLFISAEWIAA